MIVASVRSGESVDGGGRRSLWGVIQWRLGMLLTDSLRSWEVVLERRWEALLEHSTGRP